MIQRTIVESKTVDMTLVHSYLPAITAFAQAVGPVVACAFCPSTHLALVLALASSLAIYYFARMRESVFLLDPAAIAFETLLGSLFASVLELDGHEGLVLTHLFFWCIISSGYRLYIVTYGDAHVRPVLGFTVVLLVILSSVVDAKDAFVLQPSPAIPNALLFSILCIVEGYILSIYAEQRQRLLTLHKTTLFSYGSILFSPFVHVSIMLFLSLFFVQTLSAMCMQPKDHSKKCDDCHDMEAGNGHGGQATGSSGFFFPMANVGPPTQNVRSGAAALPPRPLTVFPTAPKLHATSAPTTTPPEAGAVAQQLLVGTGGGGGGGGGSSVNNDDHGAAPAMPTISSTKLELDEAVSDFERAMAQVQALGKNGT